MRGRGSQNFLSRRPTRAACRAGDSKSRRGPNRSAAGEDAQTVIAAHYVPKGIAFRGASAARFAEEDALKAPRKGWRAKRKRGRGPGPKLGRAGAGGSPRVSDSAAAAVRISCPQAERCGRPPRATSCIRTSSSWASPTSASWLPCCFASDPSPSNPPLRRKRFNSDTSDNAPPLPTARSLAQPSPAAKRPMQTRPPDFEKSSRQALRSALAAPVAPMAAAHRAMEKHGEPALLGVVEAVVERLGRARELLQIGGAGAEEIGSAGETIDRVDLGGLVAALLAPFPPGGESGRALLGEIAHRRFERRPVLLLVGVELQARLQRGDARVEKSGPVFRRETTLLLVMRRIVRRRERGAGQWRQGEHGRRGRRKRCFHGTNLLHCAFRNAKTLIPRNAAVQ